MSGFVNANYNGEIDITAASFTHSVVAATPPYYLQNGSRVVGNASQDSRRCRARLLRLWTMGRGISGSMAGVKD